MPKGKVNFDKNGNILEGSLEQENYHTRMEREHHLNYEHSRREINNNEIQNVNNKKDKDKGFDI